MTTKEIQEWVREAIKVAAEAEISLQSGLNRTKPFGTRAQPDGPTEQDYQFALSMLSLEASKGARKVKRDTHDPLIAECKQLNSDALSEVLLETGATINAVDYRNWRPTVRNIGAINGVSVVHATILATDGNLGLFVDENGHFFGHTQHFTGDVRTLFSINLSGEIQQNAEGSGPKTPRAARKKATPAWKKRADSLLAELGLDLE